MYSKIYEFILTKLKYMWKIVCIFIPCDKIAKHVCMVRAHRTLLTQLNHLIRAVAVSRRLYLQYSTVVWNAGVVIVIVEFVVRVVTFTFWCLHLFSFFLYSFVALAVFFLMRFFSFTSFRSYPVSLSLLVSFSFHSSLFIYALFTDRLRYLTFWLVFHRIIWLP